jgi:hypothetical protein
MKDSQNPHVYCGVRLQAGNWESMTCSPKGERYNRENRIYEQLQRSFPRNCTFTGNANLLIGACQDANQEIGVPRSRFLDGTQEKLLIGEDQA